jgi:hypothetical protein
MPIITYICRRKGNIYYLKPGKPILKKQDTTILQYLKRNMKSESAKNILKTLLSLVLGLLIIWAMYRNSDLGELWDIIETANFGIIGVSLIFGLIGNILRGLRWELFVSLAITLIIYHRKSFLKYWNIGKTFHPCPV